MTSASHLTVPKQKKKKKAKKKINNKNKDEFSFDNPPISTMILLTENKLGNMPEGGGGGNPPF